MQNNDYDFDELLKTLTDNFALLADEVQLLSDRKTILEHKLRFAHEQYQHLADKYAPADLEISSILAKLQLPPELQLQSPDRAGFVPLPSRKHTASKQQTAVAIRDGRQASHKLAVIRGLATASASAASGGRSLTGTTNSIRSNSLRASRRTTLSTVLEQDFTVPGKKSDLKCPYAPVAMAASTKPVSADEQLSPPPYAANQNLTSDNISTSQSDHKPHIHHSEDPICAAMYAESLPPQARSQAPSASGSVPKCPIRFLDQHSPEEVAHYFETHKHEIPRSHEICVRRYQRNEDDIRKLDAKYGNLVSMIQGLGHKHQPMLPADEEEEEEFLEQERKSNERVENWANGISAEGSADPNHDHEDEPTVLEDEEREGRFERQLKEVRVGESPSRPWGISVPFDAQPIPESRPASPVQITNAHVSLPSEQFSTLPQVDSPINSLPPATPAGKCPFGFDQMQNKADPVTAPTSAPAQTVPSSTVAKSAPMPQEKPAGCPFDHKARPKAEPKQRPQHTPQESHVDAPGPTPTFINSDGLGGVKVGSGSAGAYNGPPMVFTGPVFIGYPVDQALLLLQGLKGGK